MSGIVCSKPDTRTSPAGIPITRFELQHESHRIEAGSKRMVRCRIRVVVAGQELQARVRAAEPGSQVCVTGFLSSAGYRAEAFQLTLHAENIELLN